MVFWKQFPKRERLPDAAFIGCEQVKKHILLHCSLNYPFIRKSSLRGGFCQHLPFSAVRFFWYDRLSKLVLLVTQLLSVMELFSHCHLEWRNGHNTGFFFKKIMLMVSFSFALFGLLTNWSEQFFFLVNRLLE